MSLALEMRTGRLYMKLYGWMSKAVVKLTTSSRSGEMANPAAANMTSLLSTLGQFLDFFEKEK